MIFLSDDSFGRDLNIKLLSKFHKESMERLNFDQNYLTMRASLTLNVIFEKCVSLII